MRYWLYFYLAFYIGSLFGHWDALHGYEAGMKAGKHMREYIRQAKGNPKMIPKWYNAHNRATDESRTFRSNNPVGVAFDMLGGDKYEFVELGSGWLVNNVLEIRELKNVNPYWGLS